MNVIRDMEIVWDDLLEAFENPDADLAYFLDRETGEVFSVPSDYDDDTFWEEVETNEERYLNIPGFDYAQERLLMHQFIQDLSNEPLKAMLVKSFTGKTSYGRLDEIISFYPAEMDTLLTAKEKILTSRMEQWLEEHDIYPTNKSF